MPSDANVFLSVKIGPLNSGADISDQIVRVDIQDEDRGTDKATIVIDNPAGANGDAIREGAEIRINLGWESEHALLFAGIVHHMNEASRSGGLGRMSFTCHDFSQRLNMRPPAPESGSPPPDPRYVGTLEEIARAIVAAEPSIKFGAVRIDPMPSWSEDNPLLPGPRTTWQMLQQVAEEYRARAYVEVNSQEDDTPEEREAGGAPRLYVTSEAVMLAEQPLGRLTMCHGFGSLIEFNFERIGSGASPSATVTTVDPVTGEVAEERGPPPASDTPAALSGGQTDQIRATGGDRRARDAEAAVELANAAPVQPAELRARTRVSGAPSDPVRARRLVEQDRTRLLGQLGRGLAMGTVFLRAKSSVDIEGASSTSTGRWYLKRVNHIVEQSRPPADPRGRRSTVIRKTYRTSFVATR